CARSAYDGTMDYW
nr:immunoglobulin heavy chain junction region [Mus musculus]